jgi:hypothetical protein
MTKPRVGAELPASAARRTQSWLAGSLMKRQGKNKAIRRRGNPVKRARRLTT